MFKYRLGATLGLIMLSAACGKKPPPPVVPASEPRPAVETDDAAARAAAERGARDAEAARQREAAARRAALEEMIFFDYDQARIRNEAQAILNAKVPTLREDPSVRLTIEGHADERGSTEYNIALGLRRAVSVKDYLVGYGLDANRFQTVSFGEERPAAQGQSESAWARNRRAAFRVEGGRPVTQQPSSGGR